MKMRKWLIGMLLAFIAFFVWVPLWLLISGSLMGAEEMTQNLAPVLGNTEGTAVWPLLPMYPTLKPYIELLLDTPQFLSLIHIWARGIPQWAAMWRSRGRPCQT